MKLIVTVVFLLAVLVSAEPSPPKTMRLYENATLPIPIDTETNTLLVFPEEVTLLTGHHLTQGQNHGKTYVQQSENGKQLVLRQLEAESIVYMQLMMDETPFFFKLYQSNKPASVIRFYTEGQAPPAVEITLDHLLHTKRNVSKERQTELIRLTKSAAFLKPRLPHEYKGYVPRRVSFTSQLQDGVTATITGMGRFPKEDALIVLGHIRNATDKKITLPSAFRLNVSDARLCKFTQFTLKDKTLGPGEVTSFEAVLIGNIQDNSSHLSLNNRFAIEAAP